MLVHRKTFQIKRDGRTTPPGPKIRDPVRALRKE
jgi:hypothetical protein